MELVVRWVAAVLLAAALCVTASRLPAERPAPGPWRLAALHFRRNRIAMAAVYLLLTLAVITVFAPLLAPYAPAAQPDIVGLKGQAPSGAHPFGTDGFSRDVLSRVLYGARVSLSVALLSVLLAMTLGVAYGSLAGLAGGRTDAVMMRIIDAMLAIPRVLLLIAALAIWGRVPLPALVAMIGLTGWFGVSRIVRGQVLSLAAEEFVLSARALGARRWHILVRHIFPNIVSPVIVAATLAVGNVIILEAGLSYLGIGVQPPQPSWGNILHEGAERVSALWWLSLFPGLAIVLTVMAVNLVGDGLRDALDPKQLDGR